MPHDGKHSFVSLFESPNNARLGTNVVYWRLYETLCGFWAALGISADTMQS
jgi:hypothetical protein